MGNVVLAACPACNHNLAADAYRCPNCGHRVRKARRGPVGVVAKYIFILFQILMIVWLISTLGHTGQQMQTAPSEAYRAGTAVGATIGVALIGMVWLGGSVIFGLWALLTRPRER